ncbi:MAG: hypothetical protein E2O68_06390 [Deltaproteobacteria bacterium]|nr:MAG: hypothetical protein E2O68_06390 [Deltaproteobacteria bacterium]
MSKKPICIIDCAIKEKSLDSYERIKSNYNHPFDYHIPSTEGMKSLRESDPARAYIIFGSDSSVSDRHPWQVALADFIIDKCQSKVPTMGICFGHQLMADAFGGKVETSKRAKSPEAKNTFSGYREIEIIKDCFGFKKGESYKVFKAHSQEVTLISEEMVHMGTSDECLYDVLSHKELPYLGLQGHPEAHIEFVERELQGLLTEKEINETIEGGEKIINNFIKFVLKNY